MYNSHTVHACMCQEVYPFTPPPLCSIRFVCHLLAGKGTRNILSFSGTDDIRHRSRCLQSLGSYGPDLSCLSFEYSSCNSWCSSISLGWASLAQSLDTYQKRCCCAIHSLSPVDNMLSLGLIVFISSVATKVFFNSHSSVKEQITSEHKKMTLY